MGHRWKGRRRSRRGVAQPLLWEVAVSQGERPGGSQPAQGPPRAGPCKMEHLTCHLKETRGCGGGKEVSVPKAATGREGSLWPTPPVVEASPQICGKWTQWSGLAETQACVPTCASD